MSRKNRTPMIYGRSIFGCRAATHDLWAFNFWGADMEEVWNGHSAVLLQIDFDFS